MQKWAKIRVQRAKQDVSVGFSLLEMMIVVAVLAILAGLAIPLVTGAIHNIRLRSAGTNFAGLLQQARLRAVQDARYYSVYLSVTNGLQQEFVDIYPQKANGTSGSAGLNMDPLDPVIGIDSEIVQQPQASAPNPADLKTQFMGGNPAGALVYDGSTSTDPITFGPLGLPCKSTAVTGGSVCKGGPLAYWLFFQNNVTQKWEAVTVTPAGRIQKWIYSDTNGTWEKL